MKYFKTLGIILARTNYGEADRILTFLTPDRGKVRALAKSVRKSKSKLAGGIELFSISHLSFVMGKGEIYTLTGSRLAKHYANIVGDLDRTNAGYEMIRLLNRATEDAAEPGYFILTENAFSALDDFKINLSVVELWFRCRLIRFSGHSPNLRTDTSGNQLLLKQNYSFDFSRMAFEPAGKGSFTADHIKFLRLNFGSNQPRVINRVKGSVELAIANRALVDSILQTFVRI